VIEMLTPSPSDSDPRPPAGSASLTSSEESGSSPVASPNLPVPRYVALTVVALALGLAYAPNLRSLISIWNQDPNYSHGFLVIPVALVILWRRLVEGGSFTPRPSWWGWVGLVSVLVARALCYERGADWTETATLLPAIASLTLSFGGWPLLRRVWPAILFLTFLFPLPQAINSTLAHPLQSVATLGSSACLKLSGLWAVVEGNVILVGADTLEVAVACNGLSMLMCLSATVVAMIFLVSMAPWKRVVLLASIIPIALISNILRISATAWCYSLFGSAVGGHFAHDAAGWLMMPMALLLVGLELALLSWLVVWVEEAPAKRADRLFRH
jgi:exosortase